MLSRSAQQTCDDLSAALRSSAVRISSSREDSAVREKLMLLLACAAISAVVAGGAAFATGPAPQADASSDRQIVSQLRKVNRNLTKLTNAVGIYDYVGSSLRSSMHRNQTETTQAVKDLCPLWLSTATSAEQTTRQP
jgi:hypothetical protein